MTAVDLRHGGPADLERVLALFDEAVEWLVARGQPDQWGHEPWSTRREARDRVIGLVSGGGLWLAERDGETLGALTVGDAPDYVEDEADGDELYVQLLITSRRHAGEGLGALLVDHARTLAVERRARVLRVDCWAGAPTLVGWYESQGFTRTSTFDVGGWRGQVLAMDLPARPSP